MDFHPPRAFAWPYPFANVQILQTNNLLSIVDRAVIDWLCNNNGYRLYEYRIPYFLVVLKRSEKWWNCSLGLPPKAWSQKAKSESMTVCFLYVFADIFSHGDFQAKPYDLIFHGYRRKWWKKPCPATTFALIRLHYQEGFWSDQPMTPIILVSRSASLPSVSVSVAVSLSVCLPFCPSACLSVCLPLASRVGPRKGRQGVPLCQGA